MSLKVLIWKTSRVEEKQKESMLLLHQRHFCNVRRENFYHDMEEKDWVIQLYDGQEIVGFSTQQIIRLEIQGVERIFLFSGDTVVDRAHWQDSKLAGAFGHFMLRLLRDCPGNPIYWFLISKGFRTYRFLPVFFNRFYPVYNQETPPEYLELLGAIARHKFNGGYDAVAGVIRPNVQRDRLSPDLCVIPQGRAIDPHVRFFLDKNPNCTAGVELACIADITEKNLNRRAWRVIDGVTVIWNE